MTESTDAPAAAAPEKPIEENGAADADADTAPTAEDPAEKSCEKEKEKEEPPKEMRAVVLTGFGGLKSVKIQKKPEPAPAEGEVLVRVKAW